jgi:hypothetical protein
LQSVISFDNNFSIDVLIEKKKFSIDALYVVIQKYLLEDFVRLVWLNILLLHYQYFKLRLISLIVAKVDASGPVIFSFLGNARFIVFSKFKSRYLDSKCMSI